VLAINPDDADAHSKGYILSLAEGSGFHLDYFMESKPRKEKNDWIIGDVYVLRSLDA